MRKTLVALSVFLVALVAFSLLPIGSALSQQRAQLVQVRNFPELQRVEVRNLPELQNVQVQNFPQVQQIEGTVSVQGTILHSKFIPGAEERDVPAGVERDATADFVEGGVIKSAGFTGAVLSLHGEIQGSLGKAGTVGAILVPNVKEITEAFEQRGEIQFPLEVFQVLAREDFTSFSVQSYLTVGFPSYQIYYYNSTDRTTKVRLYIYLTH